MIKILFFVCSLFVSGLVCGQNVQNLSRFTQHDSLDGASLSVSVMNCENQMPVFGYQQERVVMPASVMKLVTSATALELLGESFQFSTRVVYTGQIVDGHIIQGNLVIIGSGDPTLGSNYLYKASHQADFIDEIAREVQALGIDSISGTIAYTSSDQYDEIVPQSWVWEDLGNYYGAGIHDVNAFDNTVKLTFRTPPYAGGVTEIIDMTPDIPYISIDNYVRSSNVNRDRAYVYGDPNTFQRTIRGTLPKGRSAFVVKASIPDPGAVVSMMLSQKLSENGVNNSGAMEQVHELDPYTLIFELQSPPLNQIVEQLNEHSVNLFAEALCREIGARFVGERSTSAGTHYIEDYWKRSANIQAGLFMEDGSGLSRMNGLSAHALTTLLVYMKSKSECSETFLNSIPLMGTEGTMRYYFRNSELKGLGRAKSGSMTRVRSFSGYVTSKTGKQLAFTVMLNHYSCQSKTATSIMEDLIEAIVLEY